MHSRIVEPEEVVGLVPFHLREKELAEVVPQGREVSAAHPIYSASEVIAAHCDP